MWRVLGLGKAVHLVAMMASLVACSAKGDPVLGQVHKFGDPDERVRERAVTDVIEIGPRAIPALVAALGDEDNHVRLCAAYALGHIGPAALPALLAALKDEDARVRDAACSGLFELGPRAREAIPALTVAAFRDKDRLVRRSAATTLSEIDPAAWRAAHQAALADPDEAVRKNAEDHAMMVIGVSDDPPGGR